VDDEKLLVKGLRFNLENEGYQVDECYDGATAVDMAAGTKYDLIILDLMMPEMDGIEACMHIRQSSEVPIIMLTARSEDTDKLLGFEYGADDYITKPFNILELKARVKALLRRSAQGAAPEQGPLNGGGLTLEPERRTVRRGTEEIDLTVKEFDLLELLMRSPGKVFSRDMLLNTVWGFDYQGEERTVDVHIRRLREKLEHDPANPAHIITKWGVGYYFRA
jgi:DNA-binding response OmpR family regulator